MSERTVLLKSTPIEEAAKALWLAINQVEGFSAHSGWCETAGGAQILVTAGRWWTFYQRQERYGLAEVGVDLSVTVVDGQPMVDVADIGLWRAEGGVLVQVRTRPEGDSAVDAVMAILARRWPALAGEASATSAEAARAGRPPDPAYDWARAELRRGRSKDEVYEEWRKRPDVADRWQHMEDPREAFRSAMKRREQGRTKPT